MGKQFLFDVVLTDAENSRVFPAHLATDPLKPTEAKSESKRDLSNGTADLPFSNDDEAVGLHLQGELFKDMWIHACKEHKQMYLHPSHL